MKFTRKAKRGAPLAIPRTPMLGLTFALATGLSLRAPPPRMASARPDATVLFVVPGPGGRRSPFGATSPAPSPEWHAVGSHLASRLSSLSEGGVAGDVLTEEELATVAAAVPTAEVRGERYQGKNPKAMTYKGNL